MHFVFSLHVLFGLLPVALLATMATTITTAADEPLAQFDPREATISSLHAQLFAGLTTCRSVVLAHLARIRALNPAVNAVVALSPGSLAAARALDARLAAGNATGPLFCVPVLLKDNFDAAGMPTTAGCLALADARPAVDAPAVAALERAGAVVLGKTNLHELALEGLSVSSLGGQTRNPYDRSRTPGGSSGGSGAALAAGFCLLATGTDTVNSLRSPASANSLVSVRPTRGLVSRAGVVPVSATQDAAGPMARSVEDVAAMLTVMAGVGFDARDNATGLVPERYRGLDYASGLKEGGKGLDGLRLGLVEGFFNRSDGPETRPVNAAMEAAVAKLAAGGATVVRVTSSLFDAPAISSALDTQRYEYRQQLDAYLQDPALGGTHPATAAELYAGGRFLVIPAEYEYVRTALASSTSNGSYEAEVRRGIGELEVALAETFAGERLDALIYPEQKNLVVPVGSPSQSGRNGILAALTGSPVVTVPVGFSERSGEAPRGVPVGMEILGRPFSEKALLRIAYQVERLLQARRTPALAEGSVEIGDMEGVPQIKPDAADISAAYPLGRLW